MEASHVGGRQGPEAAVGRDRPDDTAVADRLVNIVNDGCSREWRRRKQQRNYRYGFEHPRLPLLAMRLYVLIVRNK